MPRKSKYAVGVDAIRRMSDTDLDKYVKFGAKAVSQKYREFKKKLGKIAKFSEFVKDFEDVTEQIYGEKKLYISSSTKGLTKQQKQQVAYGINRLAHITETPKQAEKEYGENIKKVFIGDESIDDFLNQMDADEIIQLGRDNMSFITDILGSDRVRELAEEYGDDNVAFYSSCFAEVRAEIKLYDNAEDIFEEWMIPEWNI